MHRNVPDLRSICRFLLSTHTSCRWWIPRLPGLDLLVWWCTIMPTHKLINIQSNGIDGEVETQPMAVRTRSRASFPCRLALRCVALRCAALPQPQPPLSTSLRTIRGIRNVVGICLHLLPFQIPGQQAVSAKRGSDACFVKLCFYDYRAQGRLAVVVVVIIIADRN